MNKEEGRKPKTRHTAVLIPVLVHLYSTLEQRWCQNLRLGQLEPTISRRTSHKRLDTTIVTFQIRSASLLFTVNPPITQWRKWNFRHNPTTELLEKSQIQFRLDFIFKPLQKEKFSLSFKICCHNHTHSKWRPQERRGNERRLSQKLKRRKKNSATWQRKTINGKFREAPVTKGPQPRRINSKATTLMETPNGERYTHVQYPTNHLSRNVGNESSTGTKN